MIGKAVRALVVERDAWRCVRCGNDPGYSPEVHHRRLRGQGGQDCPANLVLLCGLDHALVHSRRLTVGEPEGFIVPSWQDPVQVPVVHHALGVVWLTVDGWYEKVRPEPLSSV